jgi:uncharacterized protein (TIGR02246 family)
MNPPFCRFYRPVPALQPFVSNYMLMHMQFDPRQPRVMKPFPANPEQCLYFYARDAVDVYNYAHARQRTSPASIIVGPQVARVNLTMGFDQLTIKVGFKPGALFRLFGLPMHELLDQSVESSELAGREIESINEQLRETDDYPRMIAVVEQFLLAKAAALRAPAHAVDQVAGLMLQRPGYAWSLDALAREANLSSRQLERKFQERLGMSPKLLMRVTRFAQAYAFGQQPTAATEEKAIRQVLDGTIEAWNQHDTNKYFSYFTPEAQWVNVVGMWWHGTTEHKYALDIFMQAMFNKTTHRALQSEVKMLRPDLALVRHRWELKGWVLPDGRDMSDASTGVMTMIMEKRKGRWMIIDGHNTSIDQKAVDPTLTMKK